MAKIQNSDSCYRRNAGYCWSSCTEHTDISSLCANWHRHSHTSSHTPGRGPINIFHQTAWVTLLSELHVSVTLVVSAAATSLCHYLSYQWLKGAHEGQMSEESCACSKSAAAKMNLACLCFLLVLHETSLFQRTALSNFTSLHSFIFWHLWSEAILWLKDNNFQNVLQFTLWEVRIHCKKQLLLQILINQPTDVSNKQVKFKKRIHQNLDSEKLMHGSSWSL